MNAPRAPTPPDPMRTAQAQSGMNIDTAIAQQLVNMTDQTGPDGGLSYTQNGTNSYTDSNGRTVNIPRFTANQTLSASGQRLHDINAQGQENLATLSRDQSARLGGLLDRPVDLNNDAVEGRLYDLGSRRLNPQFARDEESLRTRLVNSGIRQGSDAWNTEMDDFNQHKADTYDQLIRGGRAQSVQEILAERNQPLNEITALMSGSQVTQPNFVGTPQSSVGGTDYAGQVANNYNAQMGQYQQKLATQQAMMGGLFGLAGKAPGIIMGAQGG